MSRIPLSVPSIIGNESKYVNQCVETEWVSSAGSFVDEFEKNIALYTGSNYAVAVVNGTSALHLSLLIAGVKQDHEVIIPSITFIAPVNAITYCGANPIFMDSDNYFNIDVEKTIEFLKNETFFRNGSTINKITRRKISALLPVHVWGNAVDMKNLIEICNEMNISIIEDASESLGTFYCNQKFKGKHAGTLSSLGCLSFNGNKIITTGGGGMILTDNAKFAEKARYLSTQAKDDPLRYVHNQIGYNYRLTNIQAALGIGQLEQLNNFLNKKKIIHQRYFDFFKDIEGINLNESPSYADNNYWLNIIQIDEKCYGKSRDEIMQLYNSNSIETRPVWKPNHLQKPFQNHQSYKIERALHLAEVSLCIPSSSNLTTKQLDKITGLIQ